MNLLKKSGIVFFWSITGSAIGFAFQMGLAYILGPSEYGKTNIILGAIGALAAFSSFGLSTLVTRECAKNRDRALSILSHSATKLGLLNLLAAPAYYLSFKLMLSPNNLGAKSIVTVAIILLIGQTVAQLLHSYYKGISHNERGSFVFNFAQRLLQLVAFLVFLLFAKPSFRLPLLSSLVSLLLPLVILFLLLKGSNIVAFETDLPFSSGFYYYLTGITYSVYDSFSKVLQGNFSGSLAVGALSFGLTLGAIGNIFGTAFASVAMPEFANAWHERDHERLRKTFMDVSRWNAYLVLPVVLFLSLNLNRLVKLIGWEARGLSFIILPVLAAQFFNSFVGPNGTLLNMTGQEGLEMRNGFVKLGVGLTLGLILGPVFSSGVAMSLAFAEITVNLLKFNQLKRLFNIVPYNRSHILYLLVLAFFNTIVYLSLSRLIPNHFLWILISVFFVSLLMSLSFYFSPETEDRIALRILFHRTRKE